MIDFYLFQKQIYWIYRFILLVSSVTITLSAKNSVDKTLVFHDKSFTL